VVPSIELRPETMNRNGNFSDDSSSSSRSLWIVFLVTFIVLSFFHISLYYLVCERALLGYGQIFNIVYLGTGFPWIVLGWLGVPVVAPPSAPASAPALVKIFDAIDLRPNFLGWAAIIAVWGLIYAVVSVLVAKNYSRR